jgi:hypothetical protein
MAWDQQLVELRRCDSRGCTPVEAVAFESGAFVNVSAPANGYLARFSVSETMDFVEVATLMLQTFVSHGRCGRGA